MIMIMAAIALTSIETICSGTLQKTQPHQNSTSEMHPSPPPQEQMCFKFAHEGKYTTEFQWVLKPFHSLGPATEKARSPKVFVLVLGTTYFVPDLREYPTFHFQ